VEALRASRHVDGRPGPVIVSSADPLNLAGILTPGARISPYSNQVIAYENGSVIIAGSLGEVVSRLQLAVVP
jgi:hypothetical protein